MTPSIPQRKVSSIQQVLLSLLVGIAILLFLASNHSVNPVHQLKSFVRKLSRKEGLSRSELIFDPNCRVLFKELYMGLIQRGGMVAWLRPVSVKEISSDSWTERRITDNRVEKYFVRRQRVPQVSLQGCIAIGEIDNIFARFSRESLAGVTRIGFQVSKILSVIPVSESKLTQGSRKKSTHGLIRGIPDLFNLGKGISWRRHAYQADELGPFVILQKSMDVTAAPHGVITTLHENQVIMSDRGIKCQPK